MRKKALVKLWFYDGWGGYHTEIHTKELIELKNGKIIVKPPRPPRGCTLTNNLSDLNNFEILQIL